MRALSVTAAFGLATACASAPPQRAAREPHAEVEHRAAPKREPEGLDSHQISPVVKGRYPAFRGCHSIEYAGGPKRPGSVVLQWEIHTDGSVHRAEVAESSFHNEELDRCLVGVMKDLRFPTAPGSTEVVWKFRFSGHK